MDESWTCRECGWTNRGGRFCFECGRDGHPDPIPVRHLAPEPGDDELQWRRPALVGGAIALLVVVVAGTALLLSGGDSKAPAKGPPAAEAPARLTRAQTVDELMKIVIASRAGLAAARKGRWAQAARNRRRLAGRVDGLAARTNELGRARAALGRALVASEHANKKSLACHDQAAVSACAASAHRRATALKERFRGIFNTILEAAGRAPVAAGSF